MMFNALFLDHPRSSKNPQGYLKHGLFSVGNSILLMFYCVLGVVHGLVPALFPFSTSSAIIRSFGKLVESDRHEEEIKRILNPAVIDKINTLLNR